MRDWPERKRPSSSHVRNKVGRPTVLFVTVCTYNKAPILTGPEVHATLLQAWRDATAWTVGRYVMMPDHVHFFAEPQGDHDFDLWIRYWKRITSQNWPKVFEPPLWETDCWDTQIRSGSHYDEKWKYVLENPVRRGLVKRQDDWPYQGEVHKLSW